MAVHRYRCERAVFRNTRLYEEGNTYSIDVEIEGVPSAAHWTALDGGPLQGELTEKDKLERAQHEAAAKKLTTDEPRTMHEAALEMGKNVTTAPEVEHTSTTTPPVPTPETFDDAMVLSNSELRGLLKHQGKSQHGKKEELVRRLIGLSDVE